MEFRLVIVGRESGLLYVDNVLQEIEILTKFAEFSPEALQNMYYQAMGCFYFIFKKGGDDVISNNKKRVFYDYLKDQFS